MISNKPYFCLNSVRVFAFFFLGDAVLPQLVEWIRFHFPEGEQAAADILNGNLEIGAEVRYSFYWDTVVKLVLQGNIEPVRALLKLHSDNNTEPFLVAESLLRSMPVYNVSKDFISLILKTNFHCY